jgi:A/G-specific adenine glycosylase
MDLGSTVCTARAPKCLLCPVRTACAAAPVDATELASRAKAHAKPGSAQTRLRFEATSRYVRGRVVDRLRELPAGQRISLLDLHTELTPVLEYHDAAAFAAIVAALARDRIVDDLAGGLRLVH